MIVLHENDSIQLCPKRIMSNTKPRSYNFKILFFGELPAKTFFYPISS